TSAPLGVSAYEWSPDGNYLAYLSREPGPPAMTIAKKGAPNPPPPPLFAQALNPQGPPKALTPPDQYVDSFTWSPDSREISYSFAPVVGFLAPYQTRIFGVSVNGGAARPICDRSR